ncbi:MAG: BamA/TamA family outer membrane protein [Bacteroidia bacterium]
MVSGLTTFGQYNPGSDPKVFVVGNLVDLPEGPETLAAFALNMRQQPGVEYIIILNGDVVSKKENGSIHPDDSLRLNLWLTTLTQDERAHIFIVPGDRDWQTSGPQGWIMVQNLEKLVSSWKLPRVTWPIQNGCPGPVVYDKGATLRMVFIQTQWWNHPYDKPTAVDVACDIITERDFYEEMEDILREASDKNILLIGHYPLLAVDPTDGKMSWKQHLFPLTDARPKMYIPLPVFGTIYASMRQNVGQPKDLINARFDPFRKELLDQIRQNGQVIYLAGHSNNMQLLQVEDNYLLNAGSIGRVSFMGKDPNLRYRAAARGFAEVAFKSNGDVFANFYQYKNKTGFALDDSVFLFQSACDPDRVAVPDEVPFNQTFGFCGDQPFGTGAGFTYYDSTAEVQAGSQYKAGFVKRFLLGKHYRSAWTTPVPVQYINLDTAKGGLELVKIGGGFQTKSLRLKSPSGAAYNFRSVDKDPSRMVNYDLRQTVVATVLRDHTSTMYPYGTMITDPLMDALGILHPKPKPYLMPPDARLGPYAGQYAHLLGMLETYPAGPKPGVPGFANADKVYGSFGMLRRRYNDLARSPDQQAYMRARLFDMWVGDWDRHGDNWKWAYYKQNRLTLPIPRDRDQVFSRWDGFFTRIADWRFVRPEIEHFGKKRPDIVGLSYAARHLDRLLLNERTADDWVSAAADFQQTIDSATVIQAVSVLPDTLRAQDSAYLVSRLLDRLDHMQGYAIRLSKILDKKVDVVADNGVNRFVVTRLENGEVEVEIFQEGDDIASWKRTFDPKQTREIRLFGLNGNDAFELGSNGKRVKAPIRIRVIGGTGADTVRETSVLKPFAKHTAVYEKDEGARFEMSNTAHFRSPPNVDAYHYNRQAHKPNMWYPAPLIGYNRDDFFLLSIGAKYVAQAYGKEPYGNKHVARLTTATNSGAYGLSYKGQFRHVMHKWDLTLDVNIDRPSRYVYYFGLGNESTKSDSLFENDFYRTRYNSQRFRLGLLREFAKRSKFHLTLAYEDNEPQLDNEGVMGLPENQELVGRDRANFIRLRGELDLDFRDNKGLPRKGTRLLASETIGFIMNERDRPYGVFRLEGEAYATAFGSRPLTLGLRAGGGTTFGPVPFYHLFYLGHGNNLRGYFRNRFTGTGVAFANSELRWEPFRVRGLTSPLSAGVKVFADVGRVFLRPEESQRWHFGYGFGVFIVPYKENFTLSATLGYSVEETSFIRFGFGVPFR